MQIHLPQGRYHLQPAELLTLQGAKGRRLCCLSGCLLVTQYADPQDHVLHLGGSLQIANDQLVVVEAYGAASLEVVD